MTATQFPERNVKPIPRRDLIAVARLKPGRSHFIPRVHTVPLNAASRHLFRLIRSESPAGVKVERVA